MSSLWQNLAALSPEKRELLRRRLQRAETSRPSPGTALPLIEPEPERLHEPFPLSEVQEVYWVGRSGLFELGDVGTNVCMEFELTGTGFVPALESAVRKMVERHPMLRAVILPHGEQRILPASEIPPYYATVVDARKQSETAAAAELAVVRDRLHYAKAPIERWPLFEFVVFLLPADRLRLLIRVDALLVDGASRERLVHELALLITNPGHQPTPLACSYRDYVLAWEALRKGDAYARARDYWMARLPSFPDAPALPEARRANAAGRLQKRVLRLLDARTWSELKATGAGRRLTSSALVLTAFTDMLSQRVGRPFTLGLVSSHRPPLHRDMDAILGNFNTLSLLEVGPYEGAFEQRAHALQDRLASDLEHRLFSGLRVLRELRRLRGDGTRATLPVLFNSVLDHAPVPTQAGQAVAGAVRELDASICIPQVRLVVTVIEGDGGELVAVWQATEDTLPDGTVDAMIEDYRDGLTRAWSEVPAAPRVRSWPAPRRASAKAVSTPVLQPRDVIEQELGRLWEELLKCRCGDIQQGFFALGGDSLTLVRLWARLESRFGRRLSAEALREDPTIASLAAVLREPSCAARSRKTSQSRESGGTR